MADDHQIEELICQLTDERGPEKSICPSEVARLLSDTNWRELMPDIRRVHKDHVQRGQIVATQRGEVVDLTEVSGPIRLRKLPSCDRQL